jgi:hypothetical protein
MMPSRSYISYIFLKPNLISRQELGDVENWAGTVEEDMNAIVSILEFIHKTENDQ